jgi:hypothetical protein
VAVFPIHRDEGLEDMANVGLALTITVVVARALQLPLLALRV